MKFINHLSITDFISGFYIDPIDIHTASDQEFLKFICDKSFEEGQEFFLLCYKYSKSNSCILIDEFQSNELQTAGLLSKYHCFNDPVTSTNYWTFAATYNSGEGIELIKVLWDHFEYLRWFVPDVDLDWEKMLSYESTIFEKDDDGKRLLNFNFTDSIFIKGSGGESLSLNYKKHLDLSFLKDINSRI